MSAHFGPRAGTRPDLAFRKLVQLGGRAGLQGWMNAMMWTRPITTFEREIINSLMRCHVVCREAGDYVVTQKGWDFVGRPTQAKVAPAGQVAGPRYAPSKAPLSARHMARAGLVREGALDYAQIPSRYGSQRVAHKAKVRTA
ncbi:hypothetical protein LE191_12625 [Janthinobacterium sp. HSC-3S05]|uniref:hypothetical protein n=1 Tax=Janthinobacterium lividum TaxID=29581 RepID=UPI001CD8AF56|nr:hypothetical protein [Janthinobacterium lividum]MCA1860948.1 hypothetical protein [Janthinobacterium lividum]